MSPPFCISSLDGFVAPQDPLRGHIDQFEEQTPAQQSFEPAGLPQGQWWIFNEICQCTSVKFNFTTALHVFS